MVSTPSKLRSVTTLIDLSGPLDYNEDTNIRRAGTIIATIGSACRDEETIYNMVKAGMNIARLNFSYDSHTDHFLAIQHIREAEKRYSKELGYEHTVAIAGDLRGREIRTGIFAAREIVELKQGDVIKLTTSQDMYNKCTKDLIYIDYPGFVNDVAVGQKVFLDDNQVSLEIQEIGSDFVVCLVLMYGKLKSRVTVVVPEARIRLPIVSEKDASDIRFCIDNNVDFLMLSKIDRAQDVIKIRAAIGERGKYMKIITKLDCCRALENFDAIANESDALVFCRVDLAIEMKVGRVFLAQKAITARSIHKGIPIIIGPKVLMSMMDSPTPYRSDIGDLGYLICDGADGIMLGCVTAIGNYPAKAVEVCAGSSKEAEISFWNRKMYEDLIAINRKAIDPAHAVAISAVMASVNSFAAAIIVLTASGRSAGLIARYRPRAPILAVTSNNVIARQLQISRGIIPIETTDERHSDWNKNLESRINLALGKAYKMGVVQTGDAVVIVNPWKSATGFTNNIRVIYAFFKNDPEVCQQSKEERLVGKGPMNLFLNL